MKTKPDDTKLEEAIRKYRIASIRWLNCEFPAFEAGQLVRSLSMNRSFKVFNALGVKVVCQSSGKHPSDLAITRCLTTQEFCNSAIQKRSFLEREDVRRLFPVLFRHGLPRGYYVDSTNERPVLGLLRVDSNLVDVRRIYKRSIELVEKHRGKRGFSRLIASHQFEVSWAVPTESKADAIHLLLQQSARQIPVRAESSKSLLDGVTNFESN